jgi:hypothetical protein
LKRHVKNNERERETGKGGGMKEGRERGKLPTMEAFYMARVIKTESLLNWQGQRQPTDGN